MNEIERLKGSINNGAASGGFINELRELRRRKKELEIRMTNLQDSRRKLTDQLDSLVRLMVPSRSTPTGSGSLCATTSMINPCDMNQQQSTNAAAGANNCNVSTTGMRHLLHAADCVTTAMNNLVQELNHENTYVNDYSFPHQCPPVPMQSTLHLDSYTSAHTAAPRGHALVYRQSDYDAPMFVADSSNHWQSRNTPLAQYQQQYSTGHHQRSNSLSQQWVCSGAIDSSSEERESHHLYSDPECDLPLYSTPRRARQRGYSLESNEKGSYGGHSLNHYQQRQ